MIAKTFRTMVLLLLVLTAGSVFAQKKAKYVFYFITDGTGVNTVLGAEMFEAEKQGIIGRTPYCMTQFPVIGVSSTYSHNSGVTDSAASGTALATGVKTQNNCLGMQPDLKTPVYSVAVWAKEAGLPVGVATSVTINHATPGAFYAHQPHRSDYYAVGNDMVAADFDFYGGSAINKNVDEKKHPGAPDLYKVMEKAGYTIAYGIDDYKAKAKKAQKMLLVQDPKHYNPASTFISLPYAIDAKPGEMRIEDILQAEIEFLQSKGKDGFFLMNEIGGKVDWACHARDAATAFAEVSAVDRCMKIAYDFYKQHPDETLIVLTADHETGGLVLAEDNIYALNLKVLQHQHVSCDGFTALLHQMRKDTENNVSWDEAKKALSDCFGFWNGVEMTAAEEETLHSVWHDSFEGKAATVKNEYTENEPLTEAARKIINKKALVQWATGGHSAGLVPVYAIGVGSEQFVQHNDNSNIPLKIAKAMGIKP